MYPSIKVPPMNSIGVSSWNRPLDINIHKTPWLEAKDEVAWLEANKDNNLTHHDQERYNWRFSSVEEHGKRVIYETLYI